MVNKFHIVANKDDKLFYLAKDPEGSFPSLRISSMNKRNDMKEFRIYC